MQGYFELPSRCHQIAELPSHQHKPQSAGKEKKKKMKNKQINE